MAMPSQPASRERLVELVREVAVAVLRQPVVVAEARADLEDRLADRLLRWGEGCIHGDIPPWAKIGAVIPGLVPGNQISETAAARGTMDPGDKHRDDNRFRLD